MWWLNFSFFPSRLRRPQHNLQCVSCPVSELQQPVRWWLRHRVQTETHDSLDLLFPGPFLLEKASYCSQWRCDRTLYIQHYLSLFFFLINGFFSCLLGRRSAVGLSTKGGLERWLLILDFSSPAAVPKNRRLWHPHKPPHTFQTRFLRSSQKMWKKPGNCFCWLPL